MYEPPPEALPPEGWCNLETPPRKGERKRGTMPQSNPNKVKHEPCRSLRKDVLPTWQGPGPWDPGGPAGEQIIGLKRVVEADKKRHRNGHRRPQLEKLAVQKSSQSNDTSTKGNHAPGAHSLSSNSTTQSSFHQGATCFSIVRPIEKARHRFRRRRVKGIAHSIGTRPFSTFSGRHAHVTRILSESTTRCAATIAQYTPCAPQICIGGISLQCPDCL